MWSPQPVADRSYPRMPLPNLYSAYGLTLASEVPCPELPAGQGAPDATFRMGPVPEELPECAGRGICFQSAPGRALVMVPGHLRLLVRDGREVIIHREPGTDDATLRLFLLGTCVGLLLQQRGEMVLHASTVAKDGRAIALAGGSSVGKTTLAAAFLERGYTLVADEATLVTESAEGTPVTVPGAPNLLLWRHALEELGLWSEELRPARSQLQKFVFPVAESFSEEPQPLVHLCVLARSNREEVIVERLSGFPRFEAFLNNTFREPYLAGLGLAKARQARCGALVPHVNVSRLTWPQRWTDLTEAMDLLESGLVGEGRPGVHPGRQHGDAHVR